MHRWLCMFVCLTAACAQRLYDTSMRVPPEPDARHVVLAVTADVLHGLDYRPLDARACSHRGWVCFMRSDVTGHDYHVEVGVGGTEDAGLSVRVVGTRSSVEQGEMVQDNGSSRSWVMLVTRADSAVRADVDSLVRAIQQVTGAR